jgi:hypothetical protein
MPWSALEGDEGRLRDGRRLFEAHAGRLRRQGRRLGDADVLGKGAHAPGIGVAEDLVARPELRDLPADRFDPAGDVAAEHLDPRLQQRRRQGPVRRPRPEPRRRDEETDQDAEKKGIAGQELPVAEIDRGGLDLDQDVAVSRARRLHLLEGEHLGAPVAAAHHGFHRDVQRPSSLIRRPASPPDHP